MTDAEIDAVEARIAKRLKEAAESLLVAEENRKHINREMAKMREEAYEFEMEKQAKMTTQQNKHEYFIVAKHRYWTEDAGYYDAEIVDKHELDFKKIIKLTREDANLLSRKLERIGDDYVLLQIADPEELNFTKLIEEERKWQTEAAEKQKAVEDARRLYEIEKAKKTEAAKLAKAEKAKENKLKQLEKLKKELGIK